MPKRPVRLLAAVALILLLLVIVARAGAPAIPRAALPIGSETADLALARGGAADATAPVALGMYFSENGWDPLVVARYTSLVGASPAIIMWYQDWASGARSEFNAAQLNDVAAGGAMPMISWEADDAEYDRVGIYQSDYALSTIVNGAHDAFISRWAHAAAAWGKPLLLRPMWEMNGPWYPWGPGINGNTSALYVAAWRHIHDLFVQAGAANVRFVWCPSVTVPGVAASFADLYPGDAYVDWIGLDGYNWGSARSWQSFAQVFGSSYATLTALTTKPMIIAELGSAENGGDKAAWITQTFQTDIPTQFPRIRAVVWFDKNSSGSEPDWRIDSSAAALNAYRAIAALPGYQGSLDLQAAAPPAATPTHAPPPPGSPGPPAAAPVATPCPTGADDANPPRCPKNTSCPF